VCDKVPKTIRINKNDAHEESLEQVAKRFTSVVKSYSEHFQSYRHNVSEKARQYACGLMQAGNRKNMDRMAEVVPGSDSRNLQQFITHSKWSWRAVMDHVAKDVDELIGHRRDACFLIDESSFQKQGSSSVGVSRQWLGRQGKVDNGQVAVFAALANGEQVCPVDARFYLPAQWSDDEARCKAAGIPESFRNFKTKNALAIETVTHARENGLRFGWVGADAGYGKGPEFMFTLDDMGETFMIDIHSDFTVYPDDPAPYIPAWPGRGRKPHLYRSETKATQAVALVRKLEQPQWKWLKLRDTTRGPLRLRAYSRRVFVWDKLSAHARQYTLVVTQTEDGKETKISLSNTSERTSLKRLAHMQRQRYWVERSFEDGKSECGMADYQVRKWEAWHHHMALVMMSMRFMLEERQIQAEEHPLLSCADIEELLAYFLPRRNTSQAEIIRQLKARHEQRLRAIETHTRRSESAHRARRQSRRVGS
jgi:SRSO17 transposase